MTTQADRHRKIERAMCQQGYSLVRHGQGFRLYRERVAWLAGEMIPHTFKSHQAAAEYLCPIVHDDDFTAAIATN